MAGCIDRPKSSMPPYSLWLPDPAPCTGVVKILWKASNDSSTFVLIAVPLVMPISNTTIDINKENSTVVAFVLEVHHKGKGLVAQVFVVTCWYIHVDR